MPISSPRIPPVTCGGMDETEDDDEEDDDAGDEDEDANAMQAV